MNQATIDIDEPTSDDLDEVRRLIETFVAETDSQLGARLLEDWNQSASKFLKIFPKDYKAALAEVGRRRPNIRENHLNGF